MTCLSATFAAGRHVPGILVVSGDWSVAELANELQLIAGAVTADELRDQINYLPLSR